MTDKTFDQLLCEARLSLLDIRREVAALRVYLSLKRLVALAPEGGARSRFALAAGRSMRRRRRPPATPWRMRERMRPERESARPTPRGALGPA